MIVLIAPFLAVFDFFAMSTAGLGAPVLAVFSTAYATGLVTGGVLGDRFGIRRLFVLGAAAYVLGCVVCVCAPDSTVLLGGRAVQGVAAAAMVPQAFAMTAGGGTYTRFTASLGAASVTGQLLATVVSWRALFAVEIVVAVTGLLAARGLPGARRPDTRIDAVGLTLGVLLPLSVLVPLTVVRLTGASPLFLLPMVAVIPLGLAYRRRSLPVFASRRAVVAAAGTGAAYAGQAVLLLVCGPNLVAVGYGASFAAVSLLRRPVVQIAVAGPILVLLMLGGYSGVPLMLGGAAMGVLLPLLTAKALDGAVPGAASGRLATIQQFAAAVAVWLPVTDLVLPSV
jgi:MFS family permease